MQQHNPGEKADAFVRHQIEGRLRLRVPSRRGDDAFFRHVSDLLVGLPQVQSFATNPSTGSILIHHDGSAGPVLGAMAELIRLVPAPAPASARRITGTSRLPTLHPLSAAAFGFATLAVVQLLRRGPMAGTATENFWNAYGALRRKTPTTATALAAVGLAQLARGRVLSPIVSLVYYAISAQQLARRANKQVGNGPA